MLSVLAYIGIFRVLASREYHEISELVKTPQLLDLEEHSPLQAWQLSSEKQPESGESVTGGLSAELRGSKDVRDLFVDFVGDIGDGLALISDEMLAVVAS